MAFSSTSSKGKKKQRKQNKKKLKKEGLGPSEATLWATSPNASKKNKTKQKKEEQKKTRKTKNTKNQLFGYRSIFLFFGGSKISGFLTTWPKKRAPPKIL